MELLSYGPFLTLAQAREHGCRHYWTGKPCPRGHVAERITSNRACTACHAERQRQNYEKGGREYARQYNAEWRKRNPERFAAIQKRSREKPENRAQRVIDSVERARLLMETNPEFKAKTRLRTLVLNRLHRHLAGKSASMRELTGCSGAELVAHIEAQFQPGMSWQNHGDWHLDHIRPCASFDLTDPAQQRECFHYSNLQPLWAADNISKGDRWEGVA